MCIFFEFLLFCRRMEYMILSKENNFFQNKLIGKFRKFRMRIYHIGRSFIFRVYAKGVSIWRQEGYFRVVTLMSLLGTCSMANISFPKHLCWQATLSPHLMSVPSAHHYFITSFRTAFNFKNAFHNGTSKIICLKVFLKWLSQQHFYQNKFIMTLPKW